MTTNQMAQHYTDLENDVTNQEQNDPRPTLLPQKTDPENGSTGSSQNHPFFRVSYFFAIVEILLPLLPIAVMNSNQTFSELTQNKYFLLCMACLYTGVAGFCLTLFADISHSKGNSQKYKGIYAFGKLHLIIGGLLEFIILICPAAFIIFILASFG